MLFTVVLDEETKYIISIHPVSSNSARKVRSDASKKSRFIRNVERITKPSKELDVTGTAFIYKTGNRQPSESSQRREVIEQGTQPWW